MGNVWPWTGCHAAINTMAEIPYKSCTILTYLACCSSENCSYHITAKMYLTAASIFGFISSTAVCHMKTASAHASSALIWPEAASIPTLVVLGCAPLVHIDHDV